MTTLTALSYIHVGNHHKKVPPSVLNEERLRMLRAVWPVQMGNNVFNYGVNAQADARADEPTHTGVQADIRHKHGFVKARQLAGTGGEKGRRRVLPRSGSAMPEISTGHPTLTPRSPASTLPKSPTGGIPGLLFKLIRFVEK